MKKQLPGITPGALCKGGRDEISAKDNKTGFVQFDIDTKDNPHLPTGAALREAVSHIQNVFYAGLSTRGAGVWGLVKVSEPTRQADQFKQLKTDFGRFNIVLDSKGRNPQDLRFYSFDPEAYLNPNAIIYNRFPLPEAPRETRPIPQKQNGYNEETRINNIVRQIQQDRADITEGYNNWLAIGLGLAQQLDEGGRHYFHALSQYHPEYDKQRTDQLYTDCLRSRIIGDISGFFGIAKRYGYFFKSTPENWRSNFTYNGRSEMKACNGASCPSLSSGKSVISPKLNDLGYPASGDTVELPELGTCEYDEMNMQILSIRVGAKCFSQI